MSIFVVVSKTPNPNLEAMIAEKYPDDYYKYSGNQWFVCAGGTSIDVSKNLGIADPKTTKKEDMGVMGTAVVFAISSYYGYETSDVWDWLKVKWEKNCG